MQGSLHSNRYLNMQKGISKYTYFSERQPLLCMLIANTFFFFAPSLMYVTTFVTLDALCCDLCCAPDGSLRRRRL